MLLFIITFFGSHPKYTKSISYNSSFVCSIVYIVIKFNFQIIFSTVYVNTLSLWLEFTNASP